jgi:hypothetical protein
MDEESTSLLRPGQQHGAGQSQGQSSSSAGSRRQYHESPSYNPPERMTSTNPNAKEEGFVPAAVVELGWVIVVAMAFCAYFIYGIYFLFSDYSVCDDLWVWYYGVFSIMLGILIPTVCFVCFATPRVLWAATLFFALGIIGLLILYTKMCSDMESHGLFTWSVVSIAAQLGFAIGALVHHVWTQLN